VWGNHIETTADQERPKLHNYAVVVLHIINSMRKENLKVYTVTLYKIIKAWKYMIYMKNPSRYSFSRSITKHFFCSAL
jgi:hypothetical protein